MKVVSVEQMRRIESAADASGISYSTMMENAGRATAERVLEIIAGRENAQITILIGPGNNGGDGLCAGRFIAQNSDALVRFYLLHKRPDDDTHLNAVREMGLLVANMEDDQRYRVLHHMVASADVLLDALFGIGLRLPLRDDAARLLQNVRQAMNEAAAPIDPPTSVNPALPQEQPAARTPYILAVDCPSGLDCDTGELDKHTLHADETITFIAAKPGLLTFPGAEAVGHLRIALINIPETLPELQEQKWRVADAESVRQMLPKRTGNAHKGSTGKALVVGGSRHYFGAPTLSAHAAYRAGAGLVEVAAPEAMIPTLAAGLHEAIWLPLPTDTGTPSAEHGGLIYEKASTAQAVLIGPGWGQAESTLELFTLLVEKAREGFPPLVIDADGLNLLTRLENWHDHLPQNTILTPHPGEMARLCGTDTKHIQANRWQVASESALAWSVVIVLKGAHTLIAAPSGEVTVLPFKTDALAKAGTGDVLGGIITGLLAQGMAPYDAAVAGGYLHGLAGITAARRTGSTRSVIAGDVSEALGEAFQQIEGVAR